MMRPPVMGRTKKLTDGALPLKAGGTPPQGQGFDETQRHAPGLHFAL